MIDICLPKNNEEEIIARAGELGYSCMVFLYDFDKREQISRKKQEFSKEKIDVKIGICLRPRTISQLKKQLNYFYMEADFIAVCSSKEEIVREAVSSPKADAVFDVATATGRDAPHYRNSGFNQVLADLAAKNKVAYGVDFSQILDLEGWPRAKLWGREAQNTYICRRRLPIIIASFAKNQWGLRKPEDLSAISRLLGLNFPQSKAAVSSNIANILKIKAQRRNREYIMPGVRLVQPFSSRRKGLYETPKEGMRPSAA